MAQRATPHLALNPPYFSFLFFLFFFAFLSLILIAKNCFPLEKVIFAVHLSVFPFVSFFLASCFSCQFLVLAFCYWLACFLFQDVLLFLFFCLLSCFESQC